MTFVSVPYAIAALGVRPLYGLNNSSSRFSHASIDLPWKFRKMHQQIFIPAARGGDIPPSSVLSRPLDVWGDLPTGMDLHFHTYQACGMLPPADGVARAITRVVLIFVDLREKPLCQRKYLSLTMIPIQSAFSGAF